MYKYSANTSIIDPLTVVSLDAAKDQCRVSRDIDLEDDLITGYIKAAFDSVQGFIGAPVLEAEVDVFAPAYAKKIEFPVHPVTEITSVVYVNESGVETTLPSDKYTLRTYSHDSRIIFLQDFKTQTDNDEAVVIKVKCGYTAQTLKPAIYQAILLEIGEMYNYREDRKQILNKASQSKLRPYKIYG